VNKLLLMLLVVHVFSSFAITRENSKYSQTEDDSKYQKKIGVGYSIDVPLDGPNLLLYNNGIAFDFMYGLEQSSLSSNNIINELDGGIKLNISYCLNHRFLNYFPYLGGGVLYANEKENVNGYKGNGLIWGYHFFLGLRMLASNVISDRIGINIESGRSLWNFDKSILVKNNVTEKYNYPNFYLSFGLTYFIIK